MPDLLLLHSQFRAGDRAGQVKTLKSPLPPEGRIAVCTQVVEAGVDVSAAVLITDIAPWPSMVQRFGRCNRAGEYEKAEIIWIDIPAAKCVPYEERDVASSRKTLENLKNASVRDLPSVDGKPDYRAVIRRRDLLDLFDTTPDLAGRTWTFPALSASRTTTA